MDIDLYFKKIDELSDIMLFEITNCFSIKSDPEIINEIFRLTEIKRELISEDEKRIASDTNIYPINNMDIYIKEFSH